MKLLGLDHVVLRVSDLERSLRFYCELLGCLEERRVDEIGLCQLRAGTSLIDLVPVDGPLGRAGGAPPGEGGRNLEHFALRVDGSPPEIEAELRAGGIDPGSFERRYGSEGFALSTYVSDPDGNVVELRAKGGSAHARESAP